MITCNTAEADCTGTWYEPGNVGGSGCCHCEGSCDFSLETGTDCNLSHYDAPKSLGSCYHGHTADPMITCNVAEADCTGSWYEPGKVGGSGCCHCDASCPHSTETGDKCHQSYYDLPQSKGSCYHSHTADPMITCDVAEADCIATWCEPGKVGGSGCCHCDGSCDNTEETGTDCASSYYDVGSRRFLRALEEVVGTCTYSDVCCKNPDTNECVLVRNPPQGHSDVTLDHCPTAEEGSSGKFTVMIDEKTSRFNR